MPAHLVRALVYVLLVVWLAWPLPAHLGSSLPHTAFSSDFDTLYTTWALGWETHALTSDPTRILDANIYHPTRSAPTRRARSSRSRTPAPCSARSATGVRS